VQRCDQTEGEDSSQPGIAQRHTPKLDRGCILACHNRPLRPSLG
jgi:hypothetical protein